MFDIDILRGYTYATIRQAFNASAEICYESGNGGSANITSILTKIIHTVGRFNERYASDALYGLDKLRKIAEEEFALNEDRPFDEIIVFGIRQDGVDHAAYVMNRLLQTQMGPWDYVYPKHDFRNILAVRARAWYDKDCRQVRTDFSLREIMNGLRNILACDMHCGSIAETPFPGGINPIPENSWDEADAARIRKEGYKAFHVHELSEADLESEGTNGHVSCTVIYGEYAEGGSKAVPDWKETQVCRVYRIGGASAVSFVDTWYDCYDEVKKLIAAAKKGPIGSEDHNRAGAPADPDKKENLFTWRDIVRVNGQYHAEEQPVSPEGKGEMLKDMYLGNSGDEIAEKFEAAKTEYFDMEAFISDLSYQFRDEVAKLHNCPPESVEMLTFGDFVLAPEEQENLPYGPESCGCFINGVRI